MTPDPPLTGDTGEYRSRAVAVPGPARTTPPACSSAAPTSAAAVRPTQSVGQPARFCPGACRVAEHRRCAEMSTPSRQRAPPSR